MKNKLLIVLVLFFCSCDSFNRKSPIPDTPVSMELYILRDAPELNTIGNYKFFTKPPYINQYIGYGGILLFHDFNDEISAFDLACPHEANCSIRVDSINSSIVTCRKCKTSYDVSFGFGLPINGVSKYGLRKYKVQQFENKIYITRN
jgi:nitrite reductase/ring-hydroxylating ferredoxin subunit